MPLLISCTAGMALSFLGTKLFSPARPVHGQTVEQASPLEPARQQPSSQQMSYAALLDLNPADVAGMDIAELNLICGSDLPGAEGAEVGAHLKKLEEITALVRSETANPAHFERWEKGRPPGETSEAIYKMRILVGVLQYQCGIHYNAELAALTSANTGKAPESYREWDRKFHADASLVFLNGLLGEKRHGTCVSMPVLYVAVARRLGYPVYLAMSKGHLFCRWETPKERFNIEGTGVDGMTPRPDEFYRTFPMPLSEWELEHENYLKSMTPAQELALFLKTRAVCLAQHQRHREGLVALAQALRLAGERGIPGLEKQIAIDGFLPHETRRIVENAILNQVSPFSGVPDGINGVPVR